MAERSGDMMCLCRRRGIRLPLLAGMLIFGRTISGSAMYDDDIVKFDGMIEEKTE